MKSFRNSFAVVLTALILILGTGCPQPVEPEADYSADVAVAKSSLAISFANGDSATSVTQDITLPSKVGDVSVKWSSSNTAVISNDGVVTRPTVTERNTVVILTATLSKGTSSAIKTFVLTVIAYIPAKDVAAVKSALTLTFASGDSSTSVTRNITLPTGSNGVNVTWNSSNASVIANDGTVTRPAFADGNANVILIATLTKDTASDTKAFYLTVLAVAPYSYTVTFDSQNADTAANPSSITVIEPATKIENLPTPPVKDGFDFCGWFTKPNGEGIEFTKNIEVCESFTVYAKWTVSPISYTVSFNTNGIGEEPVPERIFEGNLATKPETPLADGYVFSGWYTDSECTVAFDFTKPVYKDIELYALWKNGLVITQKDLANIDLSTKNGELLIKLVGKFNNFDFISIITENYSDGFVFDLSDVIGINEIGREFENCVYLKSVIIPNTIKSIDQCAFADCTNLTNITIPDSVTKIDFMTFANCTNLTNITIPDSVTYIGGRAFKNCTNLTNITIPDGVTEIISETFYHCTNLTNIILPDSVTYIGDDAFAGCTNLTNITIPDGVTEIRPDAFANCTNLTNITTGSVTYIAPSVFTNCTRLTSVTISDSVTSIGGEAFANCTNLTNITIPNSVTTIYDKAFQNCTGLKSITIPNSIVLMGSHIFSDCTGLTSVTISDGATDLGHYMFANCTNLTNITIPSSLTSFQEGTFANCTSLTSINIPESATYIGASVFANCTGLTNINIPGSINEIGWKAFQNCTGLTSVSISNGVTNIAAFAFDNCTNLKNITIPSSVKKIGYRTFANCIGLTKLTIPGSVTDIGGEAFANCINLTNITIPNSVTTIYDKAFQNCTGLKTITIPASVTKIGVEAFSGCTNLSSAVFVDVNNWYIASDKVSEVDLSDSSDKAILLLFNGNLTKQEQKN